MNKNVMFYIKDAGIKKGQNCANCHYMDKIRGTMLMK